MWRLANSPPGWYVAFWLFAFLPAFGMMMFFVIKWAVIAGGIAVEIWKRQHPPV